MENYKVKVNNWDESKEVQELFINLGYSFVNNIACEKGYIVASQSSSGINFDYWADVKEITLQYLRDLVILKHNSINDARFKDTFGNIWYVDSTNSYWMFENGTWREAEEPLFKLEIIEKPIKKEGEVKMKEKEYIAKVSGDWRLVDSHELVSGRIEVPEGAEIFLLDKSFGEDTIYFVKHDGDVFHEYYISGTDIQNNTWIKGTIKVLHEGMGKVLWQRNPETPNTSIQEKLKSIKKNGEVKMKEFLNPEQGYSLVECFVGETPIPSGWIEVPEGAEIAVESWFKNDVIFYKDNGECQFDEKWITCNVEDKNGLIHTNLKTFLEWGEGNKIVWQRSEINKDIDKGLSIKEKLKFIEKWLNGEKIQYILGVESEKTQWHNFTEGAMQYIKRPDIKFREAPKYVTINGIQFKSVESLLKHVKNNFDLEDGGREQ